VSHSVRIFGLGESSVDDIFAEEMNRMTNPTMAPYAKECDCLLQITAKAKSEEEAADGMTMPWTIAERSGATPPDETRTMRVIQEEVPLIGSEKAPVGFVPLHGEAICSGVLARLCSMTGRAWTDAQVAAQELVRYENAKSELRMRRETPPGGRVIDTSMVL